MDPPPPFDHPHHRRGHHYTDQHHHFAGGSGAGGWGAVPVRSRYEYDSYEPLPSPYHHLPSDHHHHHQPPPPAPPPLPPLHRHDAPHYGLPFRAPPDAYSSPPYQNLAPHHHHHHNHQRHCDDDFRPVDEIRRVANHHHHHHHHPQQQQQLPWEETEDERRRYNAAHQLRLSPSGSRKRQRCAMHDCGDLESTSSSGPPPRRSRQQPHPNYAPDDNFVDRTSAHPGYIGHEGFSMHTDSKGNRKMQMPSQMALPGSPHAMGAGYPRCTTQKSTPTRLSVWQRIEENPAVFVPSSPPQMPKEVHVSPCKNNAGSALKELASVISVDCKGKSASGNDVDSNAGTKKNAGKNEKVLASILVKPSPESKEKEGSVKKVARKPDRVQKNVVGSTSKSVGSTACPGAGAKKVKKVIIKKIVRKIGGKDKQISRSIISEKRYSIDGNANACETEEGEITTSSVEKDVVYAHNLVSSSNTTGAGNGVDVQKEENNNLTNPSKMNAASVIESTKILFPTSVSGSQHPGKEEARSSMDPGDNNAASAIESTRVLDTSGNEHPGKEEDRISMDSGVRNATFVSENDNSQKQKEGKILALSGEMNVAIASNSVSISDGCEDSSMEESKVAKDVSENNAVYMNRVKVNHDATEVSESEDARREDSKILIGTNEEGVLVNNFIGGPSSSTTEVTVSVGEGAQKKDGIILIGSGKKSIASLGDSVGTPRTIEEIGVSQDAREEEGNMLTHPSEKDFVSVGSWGTLNTVEVSVNEVIQEKEGRMPTEPSEANTSVIHHAKASNTTELSVDEHTQEKESQMPIESCETNSFEIIHHLEAPNTTEVIMSKFVGSEVGKSLVGSNERHAGTTDNSANTPEFDEAGGTENNCMEDLLLNDRTALNERDAPLEVEDTYIFNPPSSRNVDSTNVLALDDGPVDDSTSDIILNNGVGRNATSKAEELMHLHRAYLSPENDFTLVPSRESSSVSGNSEQSVPTALTLGSNIYFSRAESEGQPEENHELVEGHQGLDVATVIEFGSLGKRKGVAGDDLISAGVQNWLILPPAVNNIAMSGQILNDDATVRKDRLGLDQIVDDDTFVSQDHDVTQDMDQRGCVHAFFSQDLSVRLCGSDMPQSGLLAPKESSRDVENQSGIALSGLHPISSINVLDRNNYQMVDVPVDNPNGPVLSALESTDVMDAELVSSEVSVDPDHTYHSNTEDPGVESNTKQDLLSSWIEAIVSDAKKENQPCKSTLPSLSSPDKLLAPKEDSRRAVFDPVVKSPQMNFTSSMLPKVAPKQVNLPSSSREPPHLSQNARHRTWHRGNMTSSTSSLHALHPSGLPPKLPLKKNGKTQNSYIRKGNALIRNPATGNHPHSSSSMDTKNKLNKPVMRRSMNFVRKVDSNDFVVHSNISVERPKTPPLPLHNKSISCTTNVPEQLSQTLQKQHVPETEKEDSIGQLNSGADNPSIKNAQQSEPSDASKVVYARPKSNKLVAAQHPGDSINSSMDKVLSLQPPTTSDLYFKKRKNQIILSSSPSDGQNTKDMTPTDSLNSGENKGLMIASSKNSITGVRDRAHKALQTTNNVGSFSHVWTLSGKQPQRKGLVGASHMKAFPRILPWKRKIYYKDFRRSHTSLLNTSSLRIVRKLLQTRNRDMIYTVSTDGFSLRKSGVLSVCGSSLKWSRSLEKHSQKVNEEATLAVAEVERKKREKRKRQSLRDKGRNDQYSVCVARNQLRHNNQASSDLRRSSTCNEYVRVNKGNQLVRNPKKVIRMLASEKVRWSLHTVRSRLAKKQQYCQFFTRFGECKKPGGKCPYIHDRAKVTICTKFLKGLCSNTSCKLTHKVLPERMPDCSYFLRGLCTNTACPYRHVKVNSNAPVCEDFLKGYCADGDECHKKHSYVCPVFEVTGECPQQSRCKLHHPKKKIKSKSSRPDILQNSSWGRYFDTSIGHDSGSRKVSTDEEERQKLQHVFSGGGFVDFIRLDADADEDVADVDATENIELMELDSGNFNAQADNLDSLIKPLRIMRTARV